MIDINKNEKAQADFKERLLKMEEESLNNSTPDEYSKMVSKIIRLYEEVKTEYENK